MNKETLRPETLFPDNPHEIRGMSKPYRAVRKAVQDPKGQLNAQGKDPSEWLLYQANASRDEILTGSTTLQELLDNLDNLDGIRFNQNIIREFLADLSNSDSVGKEPSNSDSVDKESSNFDSVGKEPSNSDSVDKEPSNFDSVGKEPSNSDSVDKEPSNLNRIDDHWNSLRISSTNE